MLSQSLFVSQLQRICFSCYCGCRGLCKYLTSCCSWSGAGGRVRGRRWFVRCPHEGNDIRRPTKVRELCACMLRARRDGHYGARGGHHRQRHRRGVTAVTTDASEEVRVLCAEVLQQCFAHAPREMAHYVQQPQPLLTAIVGVLQHQTKALLQSTSSSNNSGRDGNEAVQRSAAQLTATLSLLQQANAVAETASPMGWFEACGGVELPRRLCQLATSFHVDVGVAANAATTLRQTLELAPPSLQTASTLLHHFPTLSSLLKSVLDLGKATDDGLSTGGADGGGGGGSNTNTLPSDTTTLCSELGLIVALLLAHHDTHRQPMQTGPVCPNVVVPTQGHLVSILNQTPMAVFATLRVRDGLHHPSEVVSGGVREDGCWSGPMSTNHVGSPSWRSMRSNRNVAGWRRSPPCSRTATPQPTILTAVDGVRGGHCAACKLTFVLLTVAVHGVLPEDGGVQQQRRQEPQLVLSSSNTAWPLPTIHSHLSPYSSLPSNNMMICIKQFRWSAHKQCHPASSRCCCACCDGARCCSFVSPPLQVAVP